MTPDYSFRWGPDGRPRAHQVGTSRGVSSFLGEFLETDVGQGLAYARHLLDEARRVQEDATASWIAIGNAFRVKIGHETTTVSPLFGAGAKGKDSETLTTASFIQLIDAWCNWLEVPAEGLEDASRLPSYGEGAP